MVDHDETAGDHRDADSGPTVVIGDRAGIIDCRVPDRHALLLQTWSFGCSILTLGDFFFDDTLQKHARRTVGP